MDPCHCSFLFALDSAANDPFLISIIREKRKKEDKKLVTFFYLIGRNFIISSNDFQDSFLHFCDIGFGSKCSYLQKRITQIFHWFLKIFKSSFIFTFVIAKRFDFGIGWLRVSWCMNFCCIGTTIARVEIVRSTSELRAKRCRKFDAKDAILCVIFWQKI